MKFKSVILLAVALGCGLVAMLGVRQVLSKKPDEKSTQKVLVATVEIQPGVPLGEDNIAVRELPSDLAPEGAVGDWKDVEERSLMLGAFPGDVITKAKLSAKGQMSASTDIPIGMRVVSVPVDLTKTHSGLILPEDRVDVQVTYKSRTPDRGIVSHTKTFLEYIKVFATDSVRHVQRTDGTEFHAKNISLLVTPEQANLLKLAESKGALHLVLRNKEDKERVDPKAADERMFQDMRADFAGDGSTQTGQPPRQELTSFLDDELESTPGDAGPAPAPAAAAVQPRNVWKLEIHEGGNKRVEEIEYDDADDLVLAPTGIESAVFPWQGFMKSLLGGGGGPTRNAATADAPKPAPAETIEVTVEPETDTKP